MRDQSAVGTHRHLVSVQNPSGAPVADGDGAYTQLWTAGSPATWRCSIDPATARDLERVAAGTVIATASHIITGRYHPGITTASALVFEGRVFRVVGVSNPEERRIRTVVTAVELLGAVLVQDHTLVQEGLFQDGITQEGGFA